MNEMRKGAITQDCPYSSKEGNIRQKINFHEDTFFHFQIFKLPNFQIVTLSDRGIFFAFRVSIP